ncbi:MAG: class I SAM-dependent RNA methyltransferase, partial [Candidatus Marinimicrobia bacterium]|nr:class I SAM-dependent RNA methyltransferase [Candidatus Neomarinimicrobiota bacterium]
GIEELAVAELKELGIKKVRQIYRGAWLKASLEQVYKINYCSRLINRILAPILSFDCHSTKYLKITASKIEWDKLLSVENTFAIFSTVSNSNIKHSQYASLVLKDAIADYFIEKKGKRPSVNKTNPDIWINLHISKNRAQISIDTSGGSLHKRGYRTESVKAPMQEILASTIIKKSGWNGENPLIDPMCGSGTLLAEAILKYKNIPSAYNRKRFGFENLPDFDKDKWKEIKQNCDSQISDLPEGLISGSDIDKDAVKITKTNFENILQGEKVKIKQIDFRDISAIENSTIICNPPYGIRMGDSKKLEGFYRDLGDFLKQKCKGSTAWIYCGNRELIKSIGLKTSVKIPLKNGGLDGRLVKIEAY